VVFVIEKGAAVLHSMTGHGHAFGTQGSSTIDVEIRTVNNRYLKVSAKVSESVSSVELELEPLVRQHVRRGTVHVAIRVVQRERSRASRICLETMQSYLDQAKSAADVTGVSWQFELGSMLQLPGVLEGQELENSEALSAAVMTVVESGLQDLNRMRLAEGASMANQLAQGLREIEEICGQIAVRAPQVVDEYRRRLESRVRAALTELGHSPGELDLLREVLQHSDRCDIREELVRLASHLEQFQKSMQQGESQGRRLDFLIQEMFRETNTVGSKANDAAIAHEVVSIKTILEQMRELVQNVE